MYKRQDYDLNSPFTLNNQADIDTMNSLSGEEKTKFFNEACNKMWRNKAVCDTYEPGSTFKTFVAAMAIEEDVYKRQSVLCSKTARWFS